MKITKLEYQKNNPNRFNVYVDGKFAVGISADDVIRLKIYKDQEISQDGLSTVISQSNFGKAFSAALNYLSFRPRSEWEVRLHLKRKKYEDIDAVVEKLKDIGQINDQAFAQWWKEQRSSFRPKGQKAINVELARKGVKVKIKIENEAELATKLLLKKTFTSKEQAFRYLFSRGFGYDTIEAVIENAKFKV